MSPMDRVNERELVERCRSGDERAFQDLIDRYKDLVFASRVGLRDGKNELRAGMAAFIKVPK